MGRTGIYRIRKGWFGKCILQYEACSPIDLQISGYKKTWNDEDYKSAPRWLTEPQTILPMREK